MRIAEAAVAAAREPDALSNRGQIGEENLAFLIEDLGSRRHFQNGVRALAARAVLAHAVHAGPRLEMLLVAIVDQSIEAVDAFGDDIAAAASIAAVRAAEFDKFFAPEG